MKRLIVISAFLLGGCTVVQSYIMAKYDTHEHAMINDVRTTAELANCSSTAEMKLVAKHLYGMTLSLKNYSSSIPDNQPVTDMAEALLDIVHGMRDKYQSSNEVNPTYCKLKIESIVAASTEAQRVIARKPR